MVPDFMQQIITIGLTAPKCQRKSFEINPTAEHFSLQSCSNHGLDQSLELDIHVRKNEQVVEARKTLAPAQAMAHLTTSHGVVMKKPAYQF